MSVVAEIEISSDEDAELRFEAMGATIRLLIGPPTRVGLPSAPQAAAELRNWIEDFADRLSRFRTDSELARLNRSPETSVRCSELLCRLAETGVAAAELTGGLVDPTLLEEIEMAGYRSSRGRARERLLEPALTAAPPRRVAAPDPTRRWQRIRVDREAGTIERPPGVGIDSGGIGKGLAADLAAERLDGYQRFLVDCGGDMRAGGYWAKLDPYEVMVAHPLDGSWHRRVRLSGGAVATSGLDSRIWRQGDGFAHHLLDPATGEPVWSGVISATALAPTAVEAEARSKAALLSGPGGARDILSAAGGLFVRDDGSCEVVPAAPGSATRSAA